MVISKFFIRSDLRLQIAAV